MLSGRLNRNAAGFVQPCKRALSFQIEMFLASNRQCAFQMVRTTRKLVLRVTTRNAHWPGKEAAGSNRVFNREDCGQRFIFDDYASSAQPRGFECLSQNPGYWLLMENNFGREDRFIVARRARVAFAGNIGGGQE